MAKVYRTREGVKLYPVCGFQNGQHKILYWENKAWLRCHDSENPSQADWDELQFWEDVLEYSNCVHDGLIYMPYKYYQHVKEAIVMYDLRH